MYEPAMMRQHIDSWGPFHYHGLTLIQAWMSNHIRYKVWDEITYPLLNFNSANVQTAHIMTRDCTWLSISDND